MRSAVRHCRQDPCHRPPVAGGMLRLAAGLLVLILAACAAPGGPPAGQARAPSVGEKLPAASGSESKATRLARTSEPIPIALLLPMTGEADEVGRALEHAARLAFFDAYDPRLHLLVFDTGGKPEGAARAAQLARDAGVKAAVGPLLADGVRAAAPILMQAGIPTLALSSDRRTGRPGIWPIGFAPEEETARILSYAARHGLRRLGVLLPETPYGDRVALGLAESLHRTPLEVVASARYRPDPDLLSGPVRRLARYDERHAAWKAEMAFLESMDDDLSNEIRAGLEHRETIGGVGFDALLLAEGDPLIRTLAPLVAFYEIDPAEVRLLGTGLWDDPAVLREPNLNGAWFSAPDPAPPRALLRRLEIAFGEPAPRIATLAYDAVSLIALLAREPVVSRRLTVSAFIDRHGFLGVDGPFRLFADGRVQRHLAVIEIGGRRFRVIDPPRPAFEAAPVS
ncbi:MAG: penicillin-binding protein activator [Alphaproteobacteria bacterium]|nr:MAG: penicillin-binding protein activator [Alphaproteobacteria bacterium]